MSDKPHPPSPKIVPSDVSHVKDDGADSSCECNCLKKVSDAIIRGLEHCFYKLGCGIGQYPWAAMLCCVVFTLAMVPGIAFFFYEETAQEKLWVPKGAQALVNKKFIEDAFPSTYRFELMIVEADNILTPSTIEAMLNLDIAVKNITKDGKYTWSSLCAKRGSTCWSNSLLELWSFDAVTIRSLSQADILNTINTVTKSPVYLNPYDVTTVLGDITRNPTTGQITGAKATPMTWALHLNQSNSRTAAPDDIVDWEDNYLKIAADGQPNIKQLYYFAGGSFSEAGNAIQGDIVFLSTGYIVVIIFVAVVLGRLSYVRHRIYVTLGAVVCIGMAIAVSFGFCSYIGLEYGPVHSILPFLFLGIGIDDTFVICQSLDNLGPDRSEIALNKRIGLALKHAGVSITVTSLTDILAFAVGSSTVLPALSSFCGYAAVGIFTIYLFQATFLVGCLAYDEKRVFQTRNACCCCYIHKNYRAASCTDKGLVQKVFDNFYAPLMVKLPMKIVVVILSFGLVGLCIWGTINLEQDFDFRWFLPSDSYARAYFDASDKYFPQDGVPVNVYFGPQINYYTDYNKLEGMHLAIKNNKYVASSTVESWFYSYRVWLNDSSDPTVTALLDADNFPSSESNFYTLLNRFMFTPPMAGARFIADIKFTSSSPAKIQTSRMSLQHTKLTDARQEVKAMDSLRELVTSYNYNVNQAFPYARQYLDFESNKVIQEELYRNLGLAFLCVVIMTLLLLANIRACLLVCLSVMMALVDVGGFMYFWGLTIDTVTSINLIVAIGLVVDYSAHIAHTFMVQTGDRDDRVRATLSSIGPAVFYGGFSTFLAFVLLVASNSYVFTVFFKIFFLVVLFGMFHGLMFVPVMLSWVGPPAYGTAGRIPSNLELQQQNNLEKGQVANYPGIEVDSTPAAHKSNNSPGQANIALDMSSEVNHNIWYGQEMLYTSSGQYFGGHPSLRRLDDGYRPPTEPVPILDASVRQTHRERYITQLYLSGNDNDLDYRADYSTESPSSDVIGSDADLTEQSDDSLMSTSDHVTPETYQHRNVAGDQDILNQSEPKYKPCKPEARPQLVSDPRDPMRYEQVEQSHSFMDVAHLFSVSEKDNHSDTSRYIPDYRSMPNYRPNRKPDVGTSTLNSTNNYNMLPFGALGGSLNRSIEDGTISYITQGTSSPKTGNSPTSTITQEPQ